jgi:hypothetical protein
MLRVNKTILNFKFSFQKPLFCSRFSYFPAMGLIKRCLAIIETIFKFKILEAAWPWGIEGGFRVFSLKKIFFASFLTIFLLFNPFTKLGCWKKRRKNKNVLTKVWWNTYICMYNTYNYSAFRFSKAVY